ncbi:hypothetical protein QR680_010971 [Steinernema hermaphroditum]|uniref:Uncharacterized protein n=1 Tax=Steinernema hermaphroditum TaxID=289476 RepID=A0AA39IT67_9BILA|nr:hypothetical protein QR680_010971 [Steinernema hermaphroditum]
MAIGRMIIWSSGSPPVISIVIDKTEFTGEMYEQTTSPTAVAVVWSMFGFLSLMAIIYGLRMLWRRRQENRALVAAISAAPPRIHHHHESPEEKTWKGLVDPHTIV